MIFGSNEVWDNGFRAKEKVMKKTRFPERQMLKILRDARQALVAEVASWSKRAPNSRFWWLQSLC